MKSTFTADELNQLKDQLIARVVKINEKIDKIDADDKRNLAYFDGKATGIEYAIDLITKFMNE